MLFCLIDYHYHKEIIGLMLKVSKQIRPYKYTVGQLSTLLGDLESHLKGEEKLIEQLKKSVERLKYKIRLGKSNVFDLYKKLDGYQPQYQNVDYISCGDIEDGNILVDEKTQTYLMLSDGKFVILAEEES